MESLAPFCRIAQHVSNVFNAGQPAKATMSEEMDFIVIGYSDGSVAFANDNQKRERSLKWVKFCDRLGAADKIRSFIDEYSIDGGDIDTAIKVLRSAKFFMEAEQLATNHSRHSTYINILIEDLQKYSAALDFLCEQPVEFAIKELEQFGKLLLEQCPDKTIDLLIKIMIITSDSDVQVTELMKMFVDDNVNCAKFIKKAVKAKTSKAPMRTTVLELMLKQLNDADESMVSQLTSEIMQLIGEIAYDDALHLCLMFGFAPGIMSLYRKENKYCELMQFLTENDDVDSMLALCSELNDQSRWTELLLYLAQREDNCEPEVKKVLTKIEETSALHPLVVLEILSRSHSLAVDSIRGYVVRWLMEQNEKIGMCEEAINSDAVRMNDVEKQIEDLEYHVQTFQMSKCSACDSPLENEAIHFFCKHSYHVHCFSSYSDQANKCPAISNDSSQVI